MALQNDEILKDIDPGGMGGSHHRGDDIGDRRPDRGFEEQRILPPSDDQLQSLVGPSRFAEKSQDAPSNLKCNLTSSPMRDHSAKNHEVTMQ